MLQHGAVTAGRQHRAQEVAGRKLRSRWEGAFIKRVYKCSDVDSLVERTTRFVARSRMDGYQSPDALQVFTRQMKKPPVSLRESLPYDRGSETACHPAPATDSNIDNLVRRFPDALAAGSNKSTSGLLRQFLPKTQSDASQTHLNEITKLLDGSVR